MINDQSKETNTDWVDRTYNSQRAVVLLDVCVPDTKVLLAQESVLVDTTVAEFVSVVDQDVHRE